MNRPLPSSSITGDGVNVVTVNHQLSSNSTAVNGRGHNSQEAAQQQQQQQQQQQSRNEERIAPAGTVGRPVEASQAALDNPPTSTAAKASSTFTSSSPPKDTPAPSTCAENTTSCTPGHELILLLHSHELQEEGTEGVGRLHQEAPPRPISRRTNGSGRDRHHLAVAWDIMAGIAEDDDSDDDEDSIDDTESPMPAYHVLQ